MAFLIAVALLAALLLPAGLVRLPPAVADRVPRGLREPAADDDEPAPVGPGSRDDETTVEWTLLTSSLVQRRLDALADELDRLDRDPDIYAKAFHTMVARSAYEALLADASQLSERRRGDHLQVLGFDLLGPSDGRREELYL